MSDADFCALTVDDYAGQAMALRPPGRLWGDDPDGAAVQISFWRATAEAFVRAQAAWCTLVNIEAFPCSALGLLEAWERAFGLPDPCVTTPQTVAERQLAVCAKMTARGGQSRAFFQALAAALGYEIEITTYRPFTCGLSECSGPDQIGGSDLRFYWRVAVPGPRVIWFECGSSPCGGMPLAKISRADDLECRIRHVAQAHGDVIFAYEGV